MEASENEPKSLGLKKKSEINSEPKSLGLKKKEESTPSPLVSAGGTSALDNGTSELPKIDLEGARTYKVPAKTALGNKVISYTKPSPIIGLDEEASNKKLIADTETKKLVDNFDKYKSIIPTDAKTTTAGFYLENLKNTNPDEYKYTIDKQQKLSEEGDPLKLQEYQAELVKKSLDLKKKVLNGKIDIVSNNINDNYKPLLDDFDAVSKESEGLVTKIQGIDNYIKENFQTDENGQLITTPTNRKVAEDILNKRNEFINQLGEKKSKLDEYSNNQDLKDAITQLDDLQNDYDSSEGLYKEFVTKNPDAYKGLPEVKKQIEKEQQAQFSKDLNEQMTGGDLGIMEGSGRGATSIVKSLAYGVKNLGEDKGYGFTDKIYDDVKGSLDKFDAESNALPTGYDKPVYEDGKWNLQYLPGKLSQTVVEMAPMALATSGVGLTAGLIARGAATQELGYTLGSFIGEHLTTVSNYYDEAKEAGMSEDDAQDFANKTATAQAMISMLSPDLKLLKSNKLGLDDYTKMVAKGVSKKEAAKQTAQSIIKNLLKEVPQENLQTWKEIQDQNSMYEEMGLNDKIKKSISNDIIETTIVSSLLTAGFGLGGAKSASTLQKQAAYMAASEPQLILERGKKMLDQGALSPEDFDNLALQLVKSEEALRKMDPSLPAETKSEALPAMIEKNNLKEEKANVDDSQHDAINEKIKLKDEEIKNIIQSPSKEQIAHDEFLKGFDDFLVADEKKQIEIPKSENEMQLEGLIETDDSQKSVPIELSVNQETPITEKEGNEAKIALLEQAKKDLKEKEYWQEKITPQQYLERERAIDKEINALKKPVVVEEEKLAEKVSEDKSEPISKKNNTEQKTPAPLIDKVSKTENVDTATKKPSEKNVPDNESLVDEEDQSEENIKDDQAILKKMQDDLEVLKTFSPNNEKMDSKGLDEIKNLAVKKYQGMIERAYKAKLDGKINRSTYTIFRNAASDILGPKIAEKNREVKGQIDAIKEKIKEKLLGEGYKSGQVSMLSAPGGLTPKTVEAFIDLTAELVKRGVDAGHEVRKVVEKALEYVKAYKNYSDVLKEEGVSEEKFKKLFMSKIGEVESIVKEKVSESSQSSQNTQEVISQSNKETVDNKGKEQKKSEDQVNESNKEDKVTESVTENTSELNKEKSAISEDDYASGKKGERMGSKRIKENSKYKEVFDRVSEEAKTYEKMDLSEAGKVVREKVKEFENAGTLGQLAETLLSDTQKSPFPDEVNHFAMIYTMDRLNTLAESEQNKIIQSGLFNTAAKLSEKAMKAGTTAGKTLAAMALSAELMPVSKAGMRAYTEAHLATTQESYLSKNNRNAVPEVTKELNSLSESDEMQRMKEEIKSEAEKMANEKLDAIAEALKGKDWVKSVSDVIRKAKEKSPEDC